MAMRPVLLCLMCLVLVPAAAHAAVITAPADCDRYNACSYVAVVRAQPGEANHLTIAVVDGRTVFSDPGVVLQAGENCANEDDHAVSCLVELDGVRVLAGDGDDTIDASHFNRPATIEGGPGADKLTGGPGRDELIGGPGVDEVHGGAGPDEISFADAATPVRVDLRSQTARIGGHLERFDGIESARTGRANDVLIGDRGDNQLSGGPGRDRLYGKGGDDALLGGAGKDILRGGPGRDTLGHVPDLPGADHSHDDVGCGTGLDTVSPADAAVVIRGDCERLGTKRFVRPLRLGSRSGVLAIPRGLIGVSVRLVASVLFAGRVQRTIRRAAHTRRLVPRGVWHLTLVSPAITTARERGDALVTIRIAATLKDGRVWRSRLLLHLGRLAA
jgi:hypothetical protein